MKTPEIALTIIKVSGLIFFLASCFYILLIVTGSIELKAK